MSDSTRTSSYQPEGVAEVNATPPQSIGRYVVERELGQGGFGIVYLARDEQLQRPVAIKVPHRRLVPRPEDAEIYLAEARTVANLDHANIVPVHDVGSTLEFPCYENPSDADEEQKAFLKEAGAGLSQEGRVICVRLALFADMLKGRPWNLATFNEVGGAEGLGMVFLEETFSSPMANPKHRLHQKAARAVLKALLPDSDGDIKGNMRSEDELRVASGYTQFG